MKLVVYDDLNEFAEDLVSSDVLEKKNSVEFVEEASRDELNVCFFDTTDGEFTCYIWFKDITKIKEDILISGIAEAWAFYCKIYDEKLLVYIKTSCALTNAILKSLRMPD
jgi:hypothetical protein